MGEDKIFYKNENYNTLIFDLSHFDESTIIFSPMINKRIYAQGSIINIDADFDIFNIKALNSINIDSNQVFSEVPRYEISGDFSNGSFIEITFTICEISNIEYNLVKDNAGLKKRNNKLINENKKFTKKIDFYKKLLNTKPYKIAKVLRGSAKKIRNLKRFNNLTDSES